MTDHLIERIYAQHGAVIRKLMRKGVDEKDAPDLAVRVMLNAVDNLHQLRDPDKLEAWLMSSAENAANSYFRERSTQWEKEVSMVSDMETGEEIDIYDTLADEMTVETILKLADRTAMVNELLACLNYKESSIFLMHNLERMKFREIAEDLEMNENTVRSIHSRCCRKLRKRWEKLYGKEEDCDR